MVYLVSMWGQVLRYVAIHLQSTLPIHIHGLDSNDTLYTHFNKYFHTQLHHTLQTIFTLTQQLLSNTHNHYNYNNNKYNNNIEIRLLF